MALVSGSPAPLRDVKMVQFGVLSPDEIVSILLSGFQTFILSFTRFLVLTRS